MLPEFELWTPHSLPEALSMMAQAAPDITPIAGGTNLVVDLRSGKRTPKIVMDISHLEAIQGQRPQQEQVWFGAGETIANLLHSPLVDLHAPALKQAARTFASPLVRNRATLGGNLVDGSPAADTAPPLLALDAEVELMDLHGVRWVPIAAFFLDVRRTQRRPDELVTGVRWPMYTSPMRHGYTKLGLRKADAISVVSAAVRLEQDEDGRCREVRIALGSVAPIPLRAFAAEDCLRWQLLTPEVIAEAAQMAALAVSPISDLRASASYRRGMVAVLVRRLLEQAAANPVRMEAI
ncbi:MAG: xanthine dehydrogenase family protein subunit M [Anaerolineaceae bacterium]|nr:xanthine dehydrogenase family protein subunit M [Anaerolineaceae bacterium]